MGSQPSASSPHPERADFRPGDTAPRDFYRILTSVVIPRPIAWVSTRSPGGVDNLAPHSFFTIASTSPPIVQFTSVGRQDTLRNVEDTGEFVVSVAPRALMSEINATGTTFPRETSEFDAAGLSREPSATVAPPRVAESPAAMECRLVRTIPVGDSTIVLGEVTHIAIDPRVLERGRAGAGLLDPAARLGGNEWSGLGELAEFARIPLEEWPGRFARRGG